MTISLTKVAVLASAMLLSASSVPALACGPEVAQFIASVGKVTPLANGACEFKIDLDLRKPQHQFSPMYTCPLDIDLLSSFPVRQDHCTYQQGDTVSGVLWKMSPDAEYLELE